MHSLLLVFNVLVATMVTAFFCGHKEDKSAAGSFTYRKVKTVNMSKTERYHIYTRFCDTLAALLAA